MEKNYRLRRVIPLGIVQKLSDEPLEGYCLCAFLEKTPKLSQCFECLRLRAGACGFPASAPIQVIGDVVDLIGTLEEAEPRGFDGHCQPPLLAIPFVAALRGNLIGWKNLDAIGAPTRTRTWNPLIKSQLLYQLSHGCILNRCPQGWSGTGNTSVQPQTILGCTKHSYWIGACCGTWGGNCGVI